MIWRKVFDYTEEITVMVGSESGGYSWQTTVGTGLGLGIIHSWGKTSVVPAGETSG